MTRQLECQQEEERITFNSHSMWIKTEDLWETTTTTQGFRNLVAMAAAMVMTTTRDT
jgi:hypothetical protein